MGIEVNEVTFANYAKYIASSVCFVFLTAGIPAVIVGLISAIKPSTFDMRKVQYKDITCGSLKLTAEIERTRYDSSFPQL